MNERVFVKQTRRSDRGSASWGHAAGLYLGELAVDLLGELVAMSAASSVDKEKRTEDSD